MKLIKENNSLKKQLMVFKSNEETMESRVEAIKQQIDGFDMERYKLMDEISSLKCDLNLKETALDRSSKKMNQIKEGYLALEKKYQKQKEKLQSVLDSEKDFFKALQEVIDFYYDSLLKYSRFTTKLMYKLMMNEAFNIQEELKEDFVARHSTLKILNNNLQIPSLKINRTTVFKRLHQKVAFFQDIDFEKSQAVFDKLLQEMQTQGLKMEVNDAAIMNESKAAKFLRMKGSMMSTSFDDASYMLLNDSIGDASTSNNFLLADLDRPDNTSGNLGSGTRNGGFNNFSEHVEAIKSQIKAKLANEEDLDYVQMNKIFGDIGDLTEFVICNVDMGQVDKKVPSSDAGSKLEVRDRSL